MNQLMMSEKPGWQDSRDTSETGSGVSESFLAETERAREATKELKMKRQELFDLQKQYQVFFWSASEYRGFGERAKNRFH